MIKTKFFVSLLGIIILGFAFEVFAAWTLTGSMNNVRDGYTATLLPNGKVLVIGGLYNATDSSSSAELYDPGTGSWTTTGSMSTARYCHTAILLPNGKVLVMGGKNGGSILSSAELYDPDTGNWTTTGSMNTARYVHTAILLPNGKVLVMGGEDGSILSSAEIYDPYTGNWTTTGSMNTVRTCHAAVLLPNGKVLVVGGYDGSINLSTAELYNPSTGSWNVIGSMNTAHGVWLTATLLSNGKVLVAGGGNNNIGLASRAELYDPVTGNWTTTGSMSTARWGHTATLLPNGEVLVTGGRDHWSSSTSYNSTELYNPSTGSWAVAESMNDARLRHVITLLPNGKVLVMGGEGSLSNILSSTELYSYNLMPVACMISKTGIKGTTLIFSASDFTAQFTDSGNGSLIKVKIVSLPTNGTLKLSEVDVTINQEIDVNDLNNLTFVPDAGWNGNTSFNWNGSNGVSYALTNGEVIITSVPPYSTCSNSSTSSTSSSSWVTPTITGGIGTVGGVIFGTALNYLFYKYDFLCYKNQIKNRDITAPIKGDIEKGETIIYPKSPMYTESSEPGATHLTKP